MRPYPDELLRSVRQSLTEVLIPNIADDWARYVAKGMEKIVAHLEVRWRQELELIARDTAELDSLLRELHESLASESFAGAACAQILDAALRPLGDGPPPPAPDVEGLYERQRAYRGALVDVIEAMERATSDAAMRDRLEPYRRRVRAFLRREMDRDLILTESTFMLFGPPVAESAASAAR